MNTIKNGRLLEVALGTVATATVFLGLVGTASAARTSFVNGLSSSPSLSTSTVPANGDQNPYGVTVVPPGFPNGGTIRSGNILISNFNNGSNQQGTGSTIVSVTPSGSMSTFFSAATSSPVGLTTALVALPEGIVVVGNTPTTAANPTTPLPGSLIFLDKNGTVLLNLTDPKIQGPWDMTADTSNFNRPILYVTNVLNGTVLRINMDITRVPRNPMPHIDAIIVIGSGFGYHSDPAALVVGPTGIVLSHNNKNLYVADTANNRIQLLNGVNKSTIDLGVGSTLVASSSALHGPLGLAWSSFGTILAANGDAPSVNPPGSGQQNMLVEIAPRTGAIIASKQLDSGAPGGLFGITTSITGRPSLMYVDDDTNTVNVLTLSR